jgi:hypothetical protein
MDKKLIILASASLLAAAAARRDDGLQVIENRGQAMPKGAARAVRPPRAHRRASAAAASRELMGVQQGHIILGHIHPRWLRAEVEAKLDAGEDVDMTWIAERRARGS